MAHSEESHSVLLIEPSEDLLLVLRHHLLRSGFKVHSAGSGKAALALIKDARPELLVSDDALPDMSAAEFRRSLFLDPGTRDLPVLFLSSKRHREGADPMLRVGLDECLPKPCDTLLLVTRAQSIIARRNSQDELMRIDPLTRLLNKTSLQRQVAEDLARLDRYKRFACLALLDLDHLAGLNEAHGVPIGDLLLSALANMAYAFIRTTDLAGRYAGGQLLLYLPETREKGARILAERLLQQYRKTSEELAGRAVTFCGALLEPPRDGATWETLCARAEETMRAAKACGGGTILDWRAGVNEKKERRRQGTISPVAGS